MAATGGDWVDSLLRALSAAFGEQGGPDRPHGRPGSHLILNDELWQCHDELAAARERQRARYGDAAELPGTGHRGLAFGGVGMARGRMLL